MIACFRGRLGPDEDSGDDHLPGDVFFDGARRRPPRISGAPR